MQPALGSQRTTLSGRIVFWTLGMLAATENPAELMVEMVATRASLRRSIIGVPPAGESSGRNLAVTTEVQNYSIVVAIKKTKVAARKWMRPQPLWVMCWGRTEGHSGFPQ